MSANHNLLRIPITNGPGIHDLETMMMHRSKDNGSDLVFTLDADEEIRAKLRGIRFPYTGEPGSETDIPAYIIILCIGAGETIWGVRLSQPILVEAYYVTSWRSGHMYLHVQVEHIVIPQPLPGSVVED